MGGARQGGPPWKQTQEAPLPRSNPGSSADSLEENENEHEKFLKRYVCNMDSSVL